MLTFVIYSAPFILSMKPLSSLKNCTGKEYLKQNFGEKIFYISKCLKEHLLKFSHFNVC